MARGKHIGKLVISYSDWSQRSTDRDPLVSGPLPNQPPRSEAEYVRDMIQGMTNEEGVDVFSRVLAQDRARLVICTQSLEELLKAQELAASLGPQGFLDAKQVQATIRSRPVLTSAWIPPVTEVEQQLAEMWQDVLGVQNVGVDDNFFELGGDSLVAIRVLARCRQEFSTEQTLAGLFDYPTIRQLARRIVELRTAAGRTSVENPARERIVL
jgi:acyl carrier protein